MIKFLESVGETTLGFLELFGNLVMLGGRALRMLFTGQIHRKNALGQLSFIGVDSLPIALLISLSVGMVFTLQITNEFIKYGATSAIGGVVSIALSRELAPILVSVVISGRVGSAIAAELGSMKVTEQIDALESFAVDPTRYLVVPRVLACLLMVPLLSGLGLLIGITGGWVVATQMMGISSTLFLDSIQAFLSPADVFKGMFKSGIFGVVVAVIGCHMGLNAKKGAQGVGAATTNSVVYSMITIFILNYILSMILFPAGGMKLSAEPQGEAGHKPGPTIRLEDVHMTFGDRKILQGVTMTFPSARTSTVIGPSGCGKSTVLRLVSGLLKPTSGKVWVDDRDISTFSTSEMAHYRQQLGFVFQAGALFDSMTIAENVAFSLTEHLNLPEAEVKRIVESKLRRVNLPGLGDLYPANLSGGMQKRASLARAICRDPGTILYDEPTTGLDPITSTVIENLIVGLTHDTGATSIVVTHQHSTIFRGDTITMLYQGQVVGTGTPDEMRAIQTPLIRNFLDGIVTDELKGD